MSGLLAKLAITIDRNFRHDDGNRPVGHFRGIIVKHETVEVER